MKRFLFFNLLFLIIISCSKSEDEEQKLPITSEEHPTKEEIYNETGCYPRGIAEKKQMHLFVDDKNNVRYLYGSKKKNDKLNFWLSKFTTTGDYVWEIVKEDTQNSHAYKPVMLGNGNMVIADVLMHNDFLPSAIIPIVIRANGTYKVVDVLS
ncbi:MAG: hypothetical protein AB7V25_07920 [Mangrovibacterium sp.]